MGEYTIKAVIIPGMRGQFDGKVKIEARLFYMISCKKEKYDVRIFLVDSTQHTE